MKIFEWLKKLLGCKEEELKKQIEQLTYKNPKEEYYNNKYPKVDLTYTRQETDGKYEVDLRSFINPYDSSVPLITGKDDDEKALDGLFWVVKEIKYIPDKQSYNFEEYWTYSYQTLKRKLGDCEDGAILLYNILLKSGIPYWKLRLSAGWFNLNNQKVGHAYLTYYCEESDKWVVLDWSYWPNLKPIKERLDYKEEKNYLEVWFSWNQKYCFSKGLNEKAEELLSNI